MTTRSLLVAVVQRSTDTDIHALDVDLPGVYQIKIDPELTDDLAYETAAESFHMSVPIKVLEGFDIRVFDEAKRTELNASEKLVDDLMVYNCFKIADQLPAWLHAQVAQSPIAEPPVKTVLRANDLSEPGL
ncbi:hypothetical protein RBE51_18255 [Pseudomonas taiwanensis]|uniref:hypothetical protein n=1 Tax=Pseudomonas taiwanensis TaxID=470150 RepID=UPI0028DF41A2|nr:hypothetical protein [Pseudomonas taiwanensis]MDT8924739.1 hypothetical protein [Pseudomonas taiwanensis]